MMQHGRPQSDIAPRLIQPLDSTLGNEAQRLGAALWGRMLFPSDEGTDSLLAAGYAHMLLLERETFMPSEAPTDRRTFLDQIIAPRRDLARAFEFWSRVDPKISEQNFDQGFAAGALLNTVLALHREDPKKASLRKAFKAVAALVTERNRDADSAAVRMSDRSLQRHWSRFRSVAHFWAAAGQLIELWKQQDPALTARPTLAVQAMLGEPTLLCTLAMNYLRRAIEVEITGTRPPVRLLAASECFIVPIQYYCQELTAFDPAQFHLVLPEAAKRALDAYRRQAR